MMHPCPWCGSEDLVVNLKTDVNRSLTLNQIETQPPAWDYAIDEDYEQAVILGDVLCNECERTFRFNLDAFQAGRRPKKAATVHHYTPGYVHQAVLHCQPRCTACVWEVVIAHAFHMLSRTAHGRTPEVQPPQKEDL